MEAVLFQYEQRTVMHELLATDSIHFSSDVSGQDNATRNTEVTEVYRSPAK